MVRPPQKSWAELASGLGPRARFDLHMHSNRSDGALPPQEVLRRCARGGLDVVSITEHDLPPSLPAGEHILCGRTLVVVHGVEMSGVHEGQEYHLLVYFPEEMPSAFAGLLRERARERAQRYDEAVRRLGLPGLAGADGAAHRGERSLTRTHLSQALVDAGHAANLQDAFTRYTAMSHGHVPRVSLGFIEAIRLARAAGGFTSWAHPSGEDLQRHARVFAEGGLQGLEIWRPGMGKAERHRAHRLAHKLGLLVTGGSDFHGWKPGALGAFSFPMRLARPFAVALAA